MLDNIIEKVLGTQAVKDKINIARTHQEIGNAVRYADPFNHGNEHQVPVGDDCAAIPDGQGGYLLFAAEGIISSFIEDSPWFAGYSAVMVNISDICAMGGLPMAVTDVMWLKDEEQGQEIWAGMQAASLAYNVPIVGGHTCYHSGKATLAVSILGKATKVLTSFDAQPGDRLMMAVDMNGRFYKDYPFWDASTTASPAHLKKITGLMHHLANHNLSCVAKDISMGGIIGTLAMLMNTSGTGALLDLEKVPKPIDASWEKWLVSFPSFGYLFTVKAGNTDKIKEIFHAAEVECAEIGEVTSQTGRIAIRYQQEIKEINLK